MITDILMAMIGPSVTLVIAGITGYLVFRSNQQNKNNEVDTKLTTLDEKIMVKFGNTERENRIKFTTLEKDIAKNDERIHKEVVDHTNRYEKEHTKMLLNLEGLKGDVNQMMRDNAEGKVMMGHFDKTLTSVSDKIDIMFKAIMERNPR